MRKNNEKHEEEDRMIRQLKDTYLKSTDDMIKRCTDKLTLQKQMSIDRLEKHGEKLNLIFQNRIKESMKLLQEFEEA